MRLELGIQPRRIGLMLGGLSLYFAAQSLIVEYLIENVLDATRYRSLILTIDLFSVNAEQTIPTWYATLLLFGAAVLLAMIAVAQRQDDDRSWRHWAGLAVIFVYLSMDEGAVIHEIVADGLQNTLNLTGYLTFGWQIVAVPLLIVFGLLYARFLWRLPARTRNLFILAGLIYVGGALIVEAISANQYDRDGGITFPYLAIATIEEMGEMLGATLFIFALLDYAARMRYRYEFHIPGMPLPSSQAAVHIDPPEAAAKVDNRVDVLRASLIVPPFVRRRLLVALATVLVGTNAALVAWAFSTPRPAVTPNQSEAVPPEIIINRIAPPDTVVTRLTGTFDRNNMAARQVVNGLAQVYAEVMVVTIASPPSSFVLAANELSFDRDSLTALLRENGVSQFIIFDSAAVKVIVGNLE
ncbi:MAG: hypothetical protein JNM70_14615 [Anaerolineae bacterium]|nr:hypothetical protein [Anaerolineae bacterium]